MGSIRKSALFYVGLSSTLAIGGVLFAYFVSLPAALHFLTGFNMDHIQAMLTADSYLSFVVTYLLGAALLFQIPLLLLIINTMTPLKPSKLMKQQRFVVVGAFILGAIISPTPDMMNQTFLALPIIVMFQLGVVMVWVQNRSRDRKKAIASVQATQSAKPASQAPTAPQGRHFIPDDVLQELMQETPTVQPMRTALQPAAMQSKPVARAAALPMHPSQPVQRAAFNNAAPRTTTRPAQAITVRPLQPRPAPRLNVPTRTIDGFTSYRSPAIQISS
jgi:sec-independent protein translocase protein TatC